MVAHRTRHRARFVVVLALVAGACAPALRSTLGRAPTLSELAPFWVEPSPTRDAFLGPGGSEYAPRADVVYTLVERKVGGFSPKLEVRDPQGVKWSVKMGVEAQSEVTSSRLVWAAGYQQPFNYYVPAWRIEEKGGVHQMGPARFRPEPETLQNRGPWSWHANPFIESVQFRGLIVLMMILNSTDLKNDNNEMYVFRQKGRPEQLWYTVKDLGASLGQTGRMGPRRNDIQFFEKQRFITGVENGVVRFEFHGRHQELLRGVRPSDVRWMCQRLQRLTPRQWQDAFRAGGYEPEVTARYLRRINEKIAEGLAIGGRP